MTLQIRPARAADLAATVELLQVAKLPVADLTTDMLTFVAEENGLFTGVIGLETFGETALLRSLVVTVDARGKGVAAALVGALEVLVLANGVRELWLLTIDADQYFQTLGYVTRDRSDAPRAIRSTEEFSGLCPSDAVLMSKKLTGPGY